MEKFKMLYQVISDNGKVFEFNGKVHIGNKGSVFVQEGKYGKKNVFGTLRKPRETVGGYLQIQLMDTNGKKAFFYIHRLVAYAWLKKKSYQTDVMHKDDNPLNNSVDNLCWGTTLDNLQDMTNKGRRASWKKKYDDSVLIEIYYRRRKGESVKEIYKDFTHIPKSSFQHFTSGTALRQRKLI